MHNIFLAILHPSAPREIPFEANWPGLSKTKYLQKRSFQQNDTGFTGLLFSSGMEKTAVHWHLNSLYETESLIILGRGIIWNWFATQLTTSDQFVTQFTADYLAQGDQFLARLEGQFSLVLFNKQTHTLHAYRDTSCYYPIYYTETPYGLAVASHIKPLLRLRPRNNISPIGLLSYLRLGYTVAPHTPISDVQALIPAEHLVGQANGRFRTHRTWQTPQFDPRPIDIPELVAETKRVFFEVMDKTLDGTTEPVGVFLSGGIDSAAITAALATHYNIPQHGFTFGLDIPHPKARYQDDIPYANLVADTYRIPHTTHQLDTHFPIVQALLSTIPHADLPIVSPNIITKSYLAQQAHAHGINTIITGSGATVPFMAITEAGMKKYKIDPNQPPEILWSRRARCLSFDEIHQLFPALSNVGETDFANCSRPYFEGVRATHPMDILLAGTSLTLRANKMAYVHHIAGAAYNVGFNMFYFDFAFNRYGATIPRELKHGSDRFAPKHLLRKAFADIIPTAVYNRKKVGFPSYYWYRGELAALQQTLFSPEILSQMPFIDPQALQQLRATEIHANRKSVGKKTWGITTFLLWYWHTVLQQNLHSLLPPENRHNPPHKLQISPTARHNFHRRT